MMEVIDLKKNIISDFQYAKRDDITEVILEQNVTEIGVGAFSECVNLKKVILGPQVSVVKEGAFSSCHNLEYFKYSKNTQFENYCFSNSEGLLTLIEDDNVARAFYFPIDRQYAVTFKNEALSKDDYEVYEGRMAQQHFFPRGKIDTNQKLLYFVVCHKDGKEYSWFNTDLDLAIKSARFKASGLSYNEFFNTEITQDTRLSWDEFALLNGVCIMGRPLWTILIQTIGYDTHGRPTVKEILDVLREFDNNLYNRANLAFARAKFKTNSLDYNKMVSGTMFKRNFLDMLRTQGRIVKQ